MRRWMLWLVVATLAVGVAAPAFSGLVAPAGDEALVMVSVSPCAIFDTRTAAAGKMASGETRDFAVVGAGDFTAQGGPNGGCGVPGFVARGVPQAQAVLLNLVAIEAAGGGNLKAWAGDAAEATGGVVNYQALSPAMANSNAIAVELNQTAPGQDVKVKVNGAGVHVRGVVLGYFVAGDHTFLTYDDYDPDRDGSVAAADTAEFAADADAVDGFDGTDLLETYCAHHRLHPESYPGGPCQTVLTTVVDSVFEVETDSSLAVGVDGYPVISYFDTTTADLKVVQCTTVACSRWDPPQTVDSPLSVGKYSSLAIGVDGNPVISYYHETNGDLKVVHCTNPACSSWDTPQTLDSTGSVGFDSSLAVGVDGYPVIAYLDVTNRDLKVVHCSDIACSSWDTPQFVDSSGDVGWYPSLAIGVDGYPVISYVDVTNLELKVVHCTAASCSSFDTPQAVDSWAIFNSGQQPSLAIGVDGYPVIAYRDATNADLKVVHCTTVACSSWNTPQIVDTLGAGVFPSLAIGVDGYPVIAYLGSTDRDLKVVHCTNAACSSWDTPQFVDSPGDVGWYPSLAIGADGSPVVSYYDFTNGDLKVARLGR